jgi:hypothetical protein
MWCASCCQFSVCHGASNAHRASQRSARFTMTAAFSFCEKQALCFHEFVRSLGLLKMRLNVLKEVCKLHLDFDWWGNLTLKCEDWLFSFRSCAVGSMSFWSVEVLFCWHSLECVIPKASVGISFGPARCFVELYEGRLFLTGETRLWRNWDVFQMRVTSAHIRILMIFGRSRLGCACTWLCVFFKFSLDALQTSVCSLRFQLFWVSLDSSRLSLLAWCPLCASIIAYPCSQPLLMAHDKIVFAATATRKFRQLCNDSDSYLLSSGILGALYTGQQGAHGAPLISH